MYIYIHIWIVFTLSISYIILYCGSLYYATSYYITFHHIALYCIVSNNVI